MTTIFATSSGQPPAAIAVIRLSGPAAMEAATALAGTLPPPRRAALRTLRWQGSLLDRALVLAFPGPRSATGEDLIEFHCHGGRAVVAAVEGALAAQPGCRLAEAGEFTRRALANGRIDLAEAEGLADLLEAETEAQRVAALSAVEGMVGRQVDAWTDAAMALSARVEASIDYAEESDIDEDAGGIPAIAAEARALGVEIAAVAAQPAVERLRDGVRIVVAGPPNAGKSTLLNLLADRDAAIVSDVPGTTRDRIEVSVARAGYAYVLIDTAGLRDTTDPVEAMGVALAGDAARSADVLLWLGEEPPTRDDAVWVQARGDLPDRTRLIPGRTIMVRRDDPDTIVRLWKIVGERARAMLPRTSALPLRERHRSLCRMASLALMAGSLDAVLLAENLRAARSALAQIRGKDATEAMLDALFGRFCLGK